MDSAQSHWEVREPATLPGYSPFSVYEAQRR